MKLKTVMVLSMLASGCSGDLGFLARTLITPKAERTYFTPDQLMLQSDECSMVLAEIDTQLSAIATAINDNTAYAALGAADTGGFSGSDWSMLDGAFQTQIAAIEAILNTSASGSTPLFTGSGSTLRYQIGSTQYTDCFVPSDYGFTLSSLNLVGLTVTDVATSATAITALNAAALQIQNKKNSTLNTSARVGQVFSQLAFHSLISDRKDNTDSEALTAANLTKLSQNHLVSTLRTIREQHLSFEEATFGSQTATLNESVLDLLASMTESVSVTLFPGTSKLLDGTGTDFAATADAPARMAADYNFTLTHLGIDNINSNTDLNASKINTAFDRLCSTPNKLDRLSSVYETNTGVVPEDQILNCYPHSLLDHSQKCISALQAISSSLSEIGTLNGRLKDLATQAISGSPADRANYASEANDLIAEISNVQNRSVFEGQSLLTGSSNIYNIVYNNEPTACLDLSGFSLVSLVSSYSGYDLSDATTAAASETLMQTNAQQLDTLFSKNSGLQHRATAINTSLSTIEPFLISYASHASTYTSPAAESAKYCQAIKGIGDAGLTQIQSLVNDAITLANLSDDGNAVDPERENWNEDFLASLQAVDHIVALARFYNDTMLDGNDVVRNGSHCLSMTYDATLTGLDLNTSQIDTQAHATAAMTKLNAAATTLATMRTNIVQ